MTFREKKINNFFWLESPDVPDIINKRNKHRYFSNLPLYVYRERIETATFFSIYSFIKSEIILIISKFGSEIIDNMDNLYFETIFGEQEFNVKKLEKYLENSILETKIFNSITIEKRKGFRDRKQNNFYIIFNKEYHVGISLLLDEFKLVFENFLSQFLRKFNIIRITKDIGSISICINIYEINIEFDIN